MFANASIAPGEPPDAERAPREVVWHRTLVIFVATVLLVVGWFASVAYIGESADERVERGLVESRDDAADALVRGVSDVIADSLLWAADPAVVSTTQALLDVPTEQLVESSAQAELREVGLRFIGGKGLRGYFAIAPDGTNLASSRDANIGVTNLVAERFPALFDEVLAGSTVLTPLQPTDVPIESDLGRDPDAVSMFVATPIVDELGQVIAVFSTRIDPLAEFVEILEAERLEPGGTTLFVDRAGSMLTSDGDVILMAPGAFESVAMQSVREEMDGVTLQSYADIDGTDVIGAWTSLPQLEVGVITEVPPDGMYAASVTSQRVVTVFASAVGILLFAVWLIPLLGSRTRARERRAYLAQLHDSEAMSRAVLDTAVDAILTVDEAGSIVSVNPAAEAMFGRSSDELVGRDVAVLLPEPFRSRHDAFMREHGVGGGAGIIGIGQEIRGRRRDGTEFPIAVSLSKAQLADRRIFACVARDISDQKAAEAALIKQALTDQLTGLPNRQAFSDALAEIVSDDEANVAVLFVDMDEFKSVNDTLGHHIGDELLIAVSARISSALRPGDVLYRSGGDEFLVIAREIGDTAACTALAQRICSTVAEEPLEASGHHIRTTVSVGAAERDVLTPGHDSLVIAADLALFEAKAQGRNRHHHFDLALQAGADERHAIEDDLAQIIERDELSAYYQPLVDLDSGLVVGAEALARWHRSGHGMVGPDVFIPVAERTGLINELGSWMLHRSCRDAMRWNEDRTEQIGVAINISAPQIANDDFIDSVHSALASSGLPAELLTLEITESVLVSERKKVAATLETIADLGVEIALDDFGTGYSSLAYLRDFAITKVKIDRSFVTATNTDHEATAMLDAIVTLVHRIGLGVVAEGVEELVEAELISRLGCDVAQGYYWAKPMQNNEFIACVARLEQATRSPNPTWMRASKAPSS